MTIFRTIFCLLRLFGLIGFLSGAFALSLSAQSFWEQLPAPDGGAPRRIVRTADGRLYSYYFDQSIYRSADDGLHWTKIFTPAQNPDSGFQHIRVTPGGAWFSEKKLNAYEPKRFAVWRSDDEGQSWQLMYDSSVVFGLTQTATGELFGLKDSTNLVLGPWGEPGHIGDFIVRSSDGGQTWTLAHDEPAGASAGKIMALEHGVLAVGEDIGYDYQHTVLDPRFLYSIDTGQTWHWGPSNAGYGVTIAPSGTVFTQYGYGPLRRWPLDWMGNWQPTAGADPGSSGGAFSGDLVFFSNGTILAAGNNKIFQSDDDGVTWTPYTSGSNIEAFPLRQPLADGTLLARRDDQLVRSSTNGLSWQFSNHGVPRGYIWDFYAAEDSLWLALTSAGLWRTADAGAAWSLVATENTRSIGDWDHIMAKAGAKAIWAIMEDSLLYSSDFGASFQHSPLPAWYARDRSQLNYDPGADALFVSGPEGTYRSTDAGASWQLVVDSLFVRQLIRHPAGALVALADSNAFNNWGQHYFEARILRSFDNGAHWQRIGLPPAPLMGFPQLRINPAGDIYFFNDGWGAVYKSSDAGDTWAAGSVQIGHPVFNNAGFLYGANGKQTLSSFDGGVTWQNLPVLPYSNTVAETFNALDPRQRLYRGLYLYPGEGHLWRTRTSTLDGAYITGNVVRDLDAACATSEPGEPLPNWIVRADGLDAWYATTDTLGNYTFFLDTGAYFLSARPALDLLWDNCADSIPVGAPVLLDTTAAPELRVEAVADCPFMTVDLAVPWLVPCVAADVYADVCNHGTEPADSAWLDIAFDPAYHTVSGSNYPYALVAPDTVRVFVGYVYPGICRSPYVSFTTDCDLPATLCFSARVRPDSICLTPPGWSGADLRAAAACDGDSVRLSVRNIGPVPSQLLEFIVVEDDVVLMTQPVDYAPGQVRTLAFAATSNLLRIESEQEPGHPFSTQVMAAVQGCGGSSGNAQINALALDNGVPSEDVECVSTNAANLSARGEGPATDVDKTGFPLGYGPEQLVRPDGALEYLIRFENTSTSMVHTVTVHDTLSTWLDPATLRAGAASHAYRWAVSAQGVATFTLDGAMLPPGGRGFISVRVRPRVGAPLGTVVQNKARVDLDFSPKTTNTTTHRLGEDFLTIAALEPGSKKVTVRVAPNPTVDVAEVYIAGLDGSGHRLTVVDARGQVVHTSRFSGPVCRFVRGTLPPGVYYFRVENMRGQLAATGKIIIVK